MVWPTISYGNNNWSVNQLWHDFTSLLHWLVSDRELKITRSGDSSHTPLLQTTCNCLGGQTFRSKITGHSDFRNGTVWSINQCLGSCTVQYGGQYNTTDGFQAECIGGIQSSNKIGFWCDWSDGDVSVMMIGGGGSDCRRADHGTGITETSQASFVEDTRSRQTEYDFGYSAHTYKAPSQSYSLNLWIRWLHLSYVAHLSLLSVLTENMMNWNKKWVSAIVKLNIILDVVTNKAPSQSYLMYRFNQA